jgi:hypothetical protein
MLHQVSYSRMWGRQELNLDLRLATALLQLDYSPGNKVPPHAPYLIRGRLDR